jgi:hypothetical protein
MKDQQVGGSHYASKKIDPFTFAMANKWDPMLFSILKYLTRYKDKGTPLQDLQKAMHIAEYRKQFPAPVPVACRISVQTYVRENGLSKDVWLILDLLEKRNTQSSVYSLDVTMQQVINLIELLHDEAAAEIEAVRDKIVSGQ